MNIKRLVLSVFGSVGAMAGIYGFAWMMTNYPVVMLSVLVFLSFIAGVYILYTW